MKKFAAQQSSSDRRTVLKQALIGTAGVFGLASSASGVRGTPKQESDPESQETTPESEPDPPTIELVTTASYHGEEVGDYTEATEFEPGDELFVVTEVSDFVHNGDASLAADTFIQLDLSTIDEGHNHEFTTGLDSFQEWETWSEFSTFDWSEGEYRAVVTVTDLIEGTSNTEAARFTLR